MIFGITGNIDKVGLADAVDGLAVRLEGAGIPFLIDAALSPILRGDATKRTRLLREWTACVSEAEIIVAFGGDGTILNVARSVGSRGTPILGVNLGKLGFLAEFGAEELDRAVSDIAANRYIVEERLVLRATTPAMPGKTLYAVNDVVLDKSRSSRLIDLITKIDGVFAVTYRGDGLIISTPTGSTAYALSNGGPIVVPTSRVIGMTPIAPHTLNGRPLVLPDTSVITVVAPDGGDELLLSVDGQQEAFLKSPVEVRVERAPHNVRLVKRTDRSYYDVLRAKLFWGQDARAIGRGAE
jgi:NAD+ kinase